MARVYARVLLEWKGDTLRLRSGGPSVKIIRDDRHPGMCRVRLPDGRLSDMVNRARARDAARTILLGILNAHETAIEAPPMRSRERVQVG